MEKLLSILNEGGYQYHYENDVLSFLDERFYDIIFGYSNYELYTEIRKAKLRVLDLSALTFVPKVIYDFEFVEEIRMPILREIIPEIKKCPRLKKVIFDAKTITRLGEHSFKGWPKMNNISFGIQLKEVEYFCLAGDIDTVDFSECLNLYLPEHAFQYSRIKHIILPISIKCFVNYLFLDCKLLETIVAKGCIEAKYCSLENVYNLKTITVSPQYNKGSFSKNLESVLSQRELKTGILIDSDEWYSYYWSITDFKFYYCKRIEHNNTAIQSFYPDSKKNIIFGENTISINEESDIFYISEFQKGGLAFSNRYTKQRNQGTCVLPPVNLQQNALDSYCKIKELLNIDIREVIHQITQKVQNLDIDSIIDSYKTTIDEYTVTKVGGDDRFYSTIITQASYTDDYIEMLLPSCHSNYQDSGYTTNWPWTNKDEYDQRDYEIKNKARKVYSPDEHVTFLIKKYLERLLYMEVTSEQYLHINRAQEIASQFTYLSGLSRVLMLNSIPI